MIPKWKIALWAGIIITIIGLLIAVKHFYDKAESARIAKEQATIELKHLKDDVIRSEAKYVTKKDLDSLAKKSGVNLKPIEKDIKKLGAEVKGLSTVVAKTRGFSGSNIASTSTVEREDEPKDSKPITLECSDGEKVECPNPDPFGYMSKKQVLKLDEAFGEKKVPWGEVDFSAWQENPWGLKVHPRNYSTVTVLSIDENGRHYVHNQFQIEADGNKETIQITDAQFSEIYPKSKFRFSPRLYFGVDGGVRLSPLHGELTPNIQMALFSYGKTKVRPDWTFLGLGLGYETQENTLGFVLSPVNYNVASWMPLVENLYVGPTVGIDIKGNVSIMGGLRLGL